MAANKQRAPIFSLFLIFYVTCLDCDPSLKASLSRCAHRAAIIEELSEKIENEDYEEAILQIKALARMTIFTHDDIAVSLLHRAASAGHVALVRALLGAGVDIDLVDRFEANVLHVAVEAGAQEVRENE